MKKNRNCVIFTNILSVENYLFPLSSEPSFFSANSLRLCTQIYKLQVNKIFERKSLFINFQGKVWFQHFISRSCFKFEVIFVLNFNGLTLESQIFVLCLSLIQLKQKMKKSKEKHIYLLLWQMFSTWVFSFRS